MADWKDNKGSGPWDFTPQSNKFGYLNNPRWSTRQDAIDFCEDRGLPLDQQDKHKPCGHWHKVEVSEEAFSAGKWVAAMQQPGTPYIYVYDILYKAVVRIDTSEIPVFVESVLKLDSAYALDYDMGRGNPGAQRGAYCMNKDATRIWYLFCDQGAYPILRGHPDAQLIEVDISKTVMRVVRRTLFPGLLPAESFPDSQAGRVNDGCSDNTHTYWCTDLVAGRTIKIRNNDHSITDDHIFNYPIEGCSSGTNDESITTIDFDKNTGKLFWVYVRDHALCIPAYTACRHFIRSDVDLAQEIDDVIYSSGAVNGTPLWQNMIRVYANHILHHRSYHPSFDGHLMKRNLDCIEEDEVEGSDGHRYACIKSHFAAVANRPITGGDWQTHWVRSANSGGNVWSGGQSYTCTRINQEYLQNIFGVKSGNLFTLMHVNSAEHPARLYCIDFSNMAELSNLDISYYAGQKYGGYDDWDWTSVSAMNYQTGVIAIFRYHNLEERNYVGCFDASPSFEFLCNVPLHFIKHTTSRELLNEPLSWPFEGFTPPPIPATESPIEVIVEPGEDLGPGEIPYVPPPPPPDDAPDNVPLLSSGYINYMSIGPGQTVFFKFIGAVNDCHYPIQIGNTSAPPYSIHVLVKRGSRPTIADFERTWQMSPDLSGTGGLYWKYNTGSQTEFVEISEPMPPTTFYIMLYNNGTRSIRTRLSVRTYVD